MTSDEKSQIGLKLEKYTLKENAEIFVNGNLIYFAEIVFDADYWSNFFDFDGHHFLICVKAVNYGNSFPNTKYKRWRSYAIQSLSTQK